MNSIPLNHFNLIGDPCQGCAYYNTGDVVMESNCIGCYGFDSRPHYTPHGTKSIHWREHEQDNKNHS